MNYLQPNLRMSWPSVPSTGNTGEWVWWSAGGCGVPIRRDSTPFRQNNNANLAECRRHFGKEQLPTRHNVSATLAKISCRFGEVLRTPSQTQEQSRARVCRISWQSLWSINSYQSVNYASINLPKGRHIECKHMVAILNESSTEKIRWQFLNESS